MKEENLHWALGIFLIVIVGGIYFSDQITTAYFESPTGYAIETTPSRVVIQNYFAIAKSTNLTDGIDFGIVSVLPTAKQNGSANYNTSDGTGYYISVSSDSNVNVDFCIKAGALNTSGGDEIPLTNYFWEDSLFSNLTQPAPYGANITQFYVTGDTGVNPGSANYYRFWLDVDAGQNPGTYNNTVYFQGVANGNPCT